MRFTHGGSVDSRVRRDEWNRRRGARALPLRASVAADPEDRRPQAQARGGRGAVPPHGHHLRRLRRRGGHRAPDPLRHHPAHPERRGVAPARRRHRAARARAQRLHVRHLPPPGDHQGRPRARGPDHPEPGLRAGDDVRGARARHLLARHRHRPRAHRRERVLRARGQHAHALRRLLHAGEPGSDDAHVPRAVRPQPRARRSRTIRTTCA